MNISGGSLPVMSDAGEGGQVVSAALAKKQQQVEGKAALALIDAASTGSAAQSPAQSTTTATLGNHVNIYV